MPYTETIKLKPSRDCYEDFCHATRCRMLSKVIRINDAAGRWGRERVELCDKHNEAQCALDDKGGAA
jgi:hypothetical protein